MPGKRNGDVMFPWLDENYYRYERAARFRRRAPDPKTRRRGVDGRFLADDEFEMDLPTVYVDGEEWDPADLEPEEVGWEPYVLEEGPIFGRPERVGKKSRMKKEEIEELKMWWVDRVSEIKSRLFVAGRGPTEWAVSREAGKTAADTPVCVACGNSCVPLVRVLRGEYVLHVCKSCLTEATRYFGFSEADELPTCVGKLLALRRPGKAEKAKQRLQSLGFDLPWERVEQMAKHFREMRKNMAGSVSVRK